MEALLSNVPGTSEDDLNNVWNILIAFIVLVFECKKAVNPHSPN